MKVKENITSNLIDKLKSYHFSSAAILSRNQPVLKNDVNRVLFTVRNAKKKTILATRAESQIQIQKIVHKNLMKYNSTIENYNKQIIKYIIYDERKRIVSVFKDYLLWDETSEFLRRLYKKKESKARLPKIAGYYEKYTLFPPVYFGLDEGCVLIMKKFVKRKKKYLEYIEEHEDEMNKPQESKRRNENFELIIKPELIENQEESNAKESYSFLSSTELTAHKKKDHKELENEPPTVELTHYTHIKGILSKSFSSLMKDLSSTYRAIKEKSKKNINVQNLKYKFKDHEERKDSKEKDFKKTKDSIIIKRTKVFARPPGVTKLNLNGIPTNKINLVSFKRRESKVPSLRTEENSKEGTKRNINIPVSPSLTLPNKESELTPSTKRLVLKQLKSINNLGFATERSQVIPFKKSSSPVTRIITNQSNTSRSGSKRHSKIQLNINSNTIQTNKMYTKIINTKKVITRNTGRKIYPLINIDHFEDSKYTINNSESQSGVNTRKFKKFNRNIYQPLTIRKDKASTEQAIIKKILMRKRIVSKK